MPARGGGAGSNRGKKSGGQQRLSTTPKTWSKQHAGSLAHVGLVMDYAKYSHEPAEDMNQRLATLAQLRDEVRRKEILRDLRVAAARVEEATGRLKVQFAATVIDELHRILGQSTIIPKLQDELVAAELDAAALTQRFWRCRLRLGLQLAFQRHKSTAAATDAARCLLRRRDVESQLRACTATLAASEARVIKQTERVVATKRENLILARSNFNLERRNGKLHEQLQTVREAEARVKEVMLEDAKVLSDRGEELKKLRDSYERLEAELETVKDDSQQEVQALREEAEQQVQSVKHDSQQALQTLEQQAKQNIRKVEEAANQRIRMVEEAANQRLQALKDASQQEVRKLKDEVQQLRLRKAAVRQTLESKESEISGLKEEAKTMLSTIDELRQTSEDRAVRSDEARNDFERERIAHDAECQKLEDDVAALERQIDGISEDSNLLQQLQEFEGDNGQLVAERDALREKVQEAEDVKDRLEQKLAEEMHGMQDVIDERERQMRHMTEMLCALQPDISKLVFRRDNERSAFQAKIATLRSEKEQLQTYITSMVNDIVELQPKISTLAQRYLALKRVHKEV
jgi:chromosome segregation ATPase